jgi:hypothetical protein
MTIGPGDARWGSGRSPRRSGYRTRSYYLPDDLHFRLRNAWWHTQARSDHDSLSGLVAAALRPIVEELESRYNGGRPFPELPEGGRLVTGPRRRRSPAPETVGTASPPTPEARVDGRGGGVLADRVSESPGVHGHAGTGEPHRGGRVRRQVAHPSRRAGGDDVRAENGEDLDGDDRREERGPQETGHRARGRQEGLGKPGKHLRGGAMSPQESSCDPVGVRSGMGEQP